MEPQIWPWHRSKKISIFSVSSGILNSDFRQRSQEANMGTEAISSALRLELRPGEWVLWDARPHRFESLVQGRARIRDATNDAVGAGPTMMRAFEANDALLSESVERAQVLRDLALLAGTRFPGESLVEWSLHRQGIGRCRLYWRDGRDPASTDTASAQPCGTLKVRRHALRIATLLVLQMEGVRMMARQEDISIWAMLTMVSATTQFAWALNALRRSWSSSHRERWSATFTWPDRRDLVLWAQSEEAAGWCKHRARESAETSVPTLRLWKDYFGSARDLRGAVDADCRCRR